MDNRIDPDTRKKRMGRPPKPRPDGSLPPPKKKRVDEFGNPLPKGSNPIDPVTGKKKRGRPKKSDIVYGFSNRSPTKEGDSDAPRSKTPIKLPPFSPYFTRGFPGKDSESNKSVRSPLSVAGGKTGYRVSNLSPRMMKEQTSSSSNLQFYEEETIHSTKDLQPESPVTTASHSSANSSVNSRRVRHSEAIISSHPHSFLTAESCPAVSSMASDMDLPLKFPPSIPTNPYMSGIQNYSSMFGGRNIGPPNSFMSGGVGSMTAAGMAGMAGMYDMSNYGLYPSAAYSGASCSTHPQGIQMANSSYCYPSPYSQSEGWHSRYYWTCDVETGDKISYWWH